MQDNNNIRVESVNEEQARPSVDEVVNETVPEAEEAPRKPKKSWKKELREWIVSLAAALMVVFFIRNFLFQIIRVDGHSMDSTLADNERLFVTIPDMRINGVERGDIVICHYPNRGSTNFVKRVVGIPGDVIYREIGVTHVVYETTDENGETVTVDQMLDEEWPLVRMMYGQAPEDPTAPTPWPRTSTSWSATTAITATIPAIGTTAPPMTTSAPSPRTCSWARCSASCGR